MRILITGCAGFIGSTLARESLLQGHQVTGIDNLDDYYATEQKRENIEEILELDHFTFYETDFEQQVHDLARGMDVVFHLAGQPGVRGSWREGFGRYAKTNILGTQILLEACRSANVPRIVYSSSSSVYGETQRRKVTESDTPQPHSPYGVSKLAGEHLSSLYAKNFDLSIVSLRYFTVYGPRQRPDMAAHRLIESTLSGIPFEVFGNGKQVRDFTYVQDVVAANLAAASADVPPGFIANIAGGSAVSLLDLASMVERTLCRPLNLVFKREAAGDVTRTSASTARAEKYLGWTATTDLHEGIARQCEWHMDQIDS